MVVYFDYLFIMRISVVIPTYNREVQVKRAVLSVLEQEFLPLEVIVIDDGSQDGTAQVIRGIQEFHSNGELVHYYYQNNKGVSSARNQGIQVATGEWIGFLDSDDQWLLHKLKLQVHFVRVNPDCQIVHGNEIWMRNEKLLNQKKYHKKSGGFIFNRCLKMCLISPSAVLLRRALFNEVGTFREDFPVCEDYDLWLRVTSRFEVGFVDESVIIKYGGHEDQLSKKYFAMDYWRVLSMKFVYLSTSLPTENQMACLNEIIRKSILLINGYRKHKNLENIKEIEETLNWAKEKLQEVI